MPSNIPPSSLGIPTASEPSSNDSSSESKPKFIISGSGGHAAHPDDILASCQALKEHVTKMQDDAEKELRAFEERIKERELAEKRRVAPGWLDSESRLLEPEREGPAGEEQKTESLLDGGPQVDDAKDEDDEGAQMDRAFGVMSLK